jgi:hypothetical protein
MSKYLGNDRQYATQTITAAHVIVRSLTRKAAGVGHKLHVDNFFFSPDL